MTSRSGVGRMLIVAGGENSRLGVLRNTVYKPFLPIHGVSLVARHLFRAEIFGVDAADIVVDVHDPLLDVLARGDAGHTSSMKCDLLAHPGSIEEKILWWRGRAGDSGPALVVMGDSLAPVDLVRLWNLVVRDGFDSAVALAEVSVPVGVAEVAGSRVASFTEKPPMPLLAHTGYAVLGTGAFEYLAAGLTVPGALGVLAESGLLGAVVCPGPLLMVDSIEGLASAHEQLRRAGDEPDNPWLSPFGR